MNDIALYLRSEGPTKKCKIDEELGRDCGSELRKLLREERVWRVRHGVYDYKKERHKNEIQ